MNNMEFEDSSKLKSRIEGFKYICVVLVIIFVVLHVFNFIKDTNGFINNDTTKVIIKDFEKYYLYQNTLNSKEYIDYKNSLLNRKVITKGSLKKLFKIAADQANDKFTYFIIDSIANLDLSFTYSNMLKPIFKSEVIDNKILYIAFDEFDGTMYDKIYKVLQQNINCEYLILDLRDNGGGGTLEAIQISDLFIDENKNILNKNFLYETEVYNSDKMQYKFKKIIIFLNLYSASSSEVLALALKEHLGDNVELIGKKTVKKGVGQRSFYYAPNISFKVVSFKWDVNGKTVDDLQRYLVKYKDTKLDEKEDYMRLVDSIVN